MRKLRLREVSVLFKARRVVDGGAQIWTQLGPIAGSWPKLVHDVKKVCYLVSLLLDIRSRKMHDLGQMWSHFAQFSVYSSTWSLLCVCVKSLDQGCSSQKIPGWLGSQTSMWVFKAVPSLFLSGYPASVPTVFLTPSVLFESVVAQSYVILWTIAR